MKSLLRGAAAIVMLFAFWSTLRIGSLTIFDCTAPVIVILASLMGGKEKNITLSAFMLPFVGILLFTLAGILSMAFSSDTTDHLEKVGKVLLALSMMLCLAFVLSRKNIFSVVEVLTLLAFSGAVHSTVCILQGRFGILVGLIPELVNGLQEWNRVTGLAEHPIEAGTISAYSAVISVGLAIHTRRWLPYLLMAGIDMISLKYSASLTATFSMVVGIGAVSLYTRTYSILIAYVCVIAIALVAIIASGDMQGKLASRVNALTQVGGNYESVKTREDQLNKTFARIDFTTILFGNGYSFADNPDQKDIHNGLLASIYHFGALGLISQLCLIWFFVSRFRGDAPRNLKAILLGGVIIFAAAYLTGPPFSRRSLWIPMFILAAYMPKRVSGHRAIAPITEAPPEE
jgi:hypothetical protein